MKILVLTLTDFSNTKIHLSIDKIAYYYEEEEDTVIRMVDGFSCCVKESAKFITNQLVCANESSYTVYNSEETNEN